jgi:hypothetical protein
MLSIDWSVNRKTVTFQTAQQRATIERRLACNSTDGVSAF